MILAGNQSKQRGPHHIYLQNQDGVRQRQSFLVKYVTSHQLCMIVTDIGACISCNFTPDNMQLQELILTQILIC